VSDEKFIEDLRKFHDRTKGDRVFSYMFEQARSQASAEEMDIIDAIKAQLQLFLR